MRGGVRRDGSEPAAARRLRAAAQVLARRGGARTHQKRRETRSGADEGGEAPVGAGARRVVSGPRRGRRAVPRRAPLPGGRRRDGALQEDPRFENRAAVVRPGPQGAAVGRVGPAGPGAQAGRRAGRVAPRLSETGQPARVEKPRSRGARARFEGRGAAPHGLGHFMLGCGRRGRGLRTGAAVAPAAAQETARPDVPPAGRRRRGGRPALQGDHGADALRAGPLRARRQSLSGGRGSRRGRRRVPAAAVGARGGVLRGRLEGRAVAPGPRGAGAGVSRRGARAPSAGARVVGPAGRSEIARARAADRRGLCRRGRRDRDAHAHQRARGALRGPAVEGPVRVSGIGGGRRELAALLSGGAPPLPRDPLGAHGHCDGPPDGDRRHQASVHARGLRLESGRGKL
mmetsp:Transcript_8162/g.24277  ORF Transcript_8162/g.24277 Transcript_8162/m.24277 type:complete len:401 (+) Transcript_8162:1359-2561(+)